MFFVPSPARSELAFFPNDRRCGAQGWLPSNCYSLYTISSNRHIAKICDFQTQTKLVRFQFPLFRVCLTHLHLHISFISNSAYLRDIVVQFSQSKSSDYI